jgi:hypothetical protein
MAGTRIHRQGNVPSEGEEVMADDLKDALTAAITTPEDDTLFQALVVRAMSELQLDDRDVAERVSCPISTIKRWKSGKGSPHPAVRPNVYKYFMKVIDEMEKK